MRSWPVIALGLLLGIARPGAADFEQVLRADGSLQLDRAWKQALVEVTAEGFDVNAVAAAGW